MFSESVLAGLPFSLRQSFGFEGSMWDLIVSVPDHYLSFYFTGFVLLLEPFQLMSKFTIHRLYIFSDHVYC